MAVGDILPGSSFSDRDSTLQDCCNLCTNHPHCTAWEYSIVDGLEHVCVLKAGSPQFVEAGDDGNTEVWAGQPSGTMFVDSLLTC